MRRAAAQESLAEVATLVRTGCVSIDREPAPAPAPGFVRIRVSRTGICGSDLSTWQGHHPYKRAPAILGHEFCGTVDALGEGVTRWRMGDRVCAMAYAPCDRCDACDAGREHLCRQKQTFSHGGWGGSFATWVCARETMLFALPDSVGDEAGALVEPLAIGLHAMRLAGGLDKASVAIIGAGNIGLACTLTARRLKAQDVTCIDINEDKRSLAAACGANAFITAPVGPQNRRFDVVVLACGYPRALDDALVLTAPGGRVVVVSYFGEPLAFAADEMVRDEIAVIGSALADRSDCATIISWLADGSLDPAAMITHRMDLCRIDEALALMAAGTGRVGKIMLAPGGGQSRQ